MDKPTKDPRHRESIIKQYIAKGITRRQAGIRLGLSVTYVSTLKSKYLRKGKPAFCHGNTGKTSTRRIDRTIETKLVMSGFPFTEEWG